MSDYTVEDFLDDRAASIEDRVKRGVRTVYFLHNTLTPGNVRATRQNIPLADVPKVGQVVDLPGAGLYGADVQWRVDDVEDTGPAAYTIYCKDLG